MVKEMNMLNIPEAETRPMFPWRCRYNGREGYCFGVYQVSEYDGTNLVHRVVAVVQMDHWENHGMETVPVHMVKIIPNWIV
jgi:hypothetical protein